ncbi:hypothetical protein SAMN05421780_11619 [Flexibacter flexilis DSM 6793]|uniref:Uncharacterized protein n=1 Tax=Flexibacter flexilis DSM 6793 TaxID=927664 RepID=A0A1I1NKS0_9BACT|nr:hypothetical protein SAMN05421780_11619 [Flexibacter flexilis DSM 6793]
MPYKGIWATKAASYIFSIREKNLLLGLARLGNKIGASLCGI